MPWEFKLTLGSQGSNMNIMFPVFPLQISKCSKDAYASRRVFVNWYVTEGIERHPRSAYEALLDLVETMLRFSE